MGHAIINQGSIYVKCSVIMNTCFQGSHLRNNQSIPIPKGYHPEFDDTEFVAEEEKAKYMSMIGTMAGYTWKI